MVALRATHVGAKASKEALAFLHTQVKAGYAGSDGKDDPLVPFACGQDTARRIPQAQLVGVHGMGHDLPPGVVHHILQPLLPHLRRNSVP